MLMILPQFPEVGLSAKGWYQLLKIEKEKKKGVHVCLVGKRFDKILEVKLGSARDITKSPKF